jgi:hypothetical protein
MDFEEFMEDTFSKEFIDDAEKEYVKAEEEGKRFVIADFPELKGSELDRVADLYGMSRNIFERIPFVGCKMLRNRINSRAEGIGMVIPAGVKLRWIEKIPFVGIYFLNRR